MNNVIITNLIEILFFFSICVIYHNNYFFSIFT